MPVKRSLNKKVCTAIFEIDDALSDAIANDDKTVILDIKTVQIVLDYTKRAITAVV
jgi:ABC-type phosphate/phosphonate transport system ATPase subunit